MNVGYYRLFILCEISINYERFFLLFHNCLVFKQELNKWGSISSSSLQYELRGKSIFLNLKSILFYSGLKHCLMLYTETF